MHKYDKIKWTITKNDFSLDYSLYRCLPNKKDLPEPEKSFLVGATLTNWTRIKRELVAMHRIVDNTYPNLIIVR